MTKKLAMKKFVRTTSRERPSLKLPENMIFLYLAFTTCCVTPVQLKGMHGHAATIEKRTESAIDKL